jgi:hypothetical protein
MGPLTRAYGPPVYFKELAISLRQGVMVKILCPDDLLASSFPESKRHFLNCDFPLLRIGLTTFVNSRSRGSSTESDAESFERLSNGAGVARKNSAYGTSKRSQPLRLTEKT